MCLRPVRSTPPRKLPVQLLWPTLFLLTCLLHPFPTQPGCPFITLRVLVGTVGPLVCIFGKRGVAGPRAASGSLSLQLGPLSAPPASSAPTPFSSHSCSPLART